MRILLVSALPEEVQGMPYEVTLTGVGKINATRVLTEKIVMWDGRKPMLPDIVINYGTAAKCSNRVQVGELYEIGSYIQRDMNVTQLGFENYQTPFGKGMINGGKGDLVCATGDSFWEGDTQFTEEYDVADMEAYALASVCETYNIPFRCFKYISDDWDAKQWQENCRKGVELFVARMRLNA